MAEHQLSKKSRAVILLVEDDYMNRCMMFDFLTRQGYQVLTATNGVDGITLAKHWKPDLIIMDLELPFTHGLDAVKEIKSWGETENIPVLCITASIKPGQKEDAFIIGCDDYQTKPFLLKEFHARIEQLLNLGSEAPGPETII